MWMGTCKWGIRCLEYWKKDKYCFQWFTACMEFIFITYWPLTSLNWASSRLISPGLRLFVQKPIHVNNTETSIERNYWPYVLGINWQPSLIARFIGSTWGLPGADRTHVVPMILAILVCIQHTKVSHTTWRHHEETRLKKNHIVIPRVDWVSYSTM